MIVCRSYAVEGSNQLVTHGIGVKGSEEEVGRGGRDGSPVGQDGVRIIVEASKDDCGEHDENESGEVVCCSIRRH
jgi:hypothetical protein